MAKEIIHVKLGIKPFSANKMHYMSKKKDTREYKEFKGTIQELLGGENYRIKKHVQLKLTLVTGFSNKASDLDNAFKPLLDAMQLAMNFDDKQVYEINAYKDVVPRGQEYLYIRLEQIQPAGILRKIGKLMEKLTNGYK